ncbi:MULTISPECIES: hypothetical protein [Cyanophyceae]|uniref:hypothetical protein n=1 Tax=Cyanophyceae TaxID=3028117 RepID=UPI00016DC8EB|nr:MULTISPECIES: hypothetical protein [Cyanophyceae]ACA99510.1 conserved hypothetical protein [Picosynechococcus sp. PCC 7002]SMH30238.1 hypothetical protein SAMN06272755_0177 [Picosynechococcus sp. OG1]SMQ83858.1 hypothetical protein SAMN06272774_2553 [Synechococcus sp. 7002]
MIGFLALLPRALTTFLYAVAALLRFYADTDTIPIQLFPLTILQWSFLAFALGTASLLVNLGLEWHSGNRAKNERARAEDEANRERDRANQERERAARRARIQNRGFILQTRYQLTPGRETGAALTDFLSFLQEYGE